MAIQKVRKAGHPVLSRVAEPVSEFGSEALHTLVADMWEVVADLNGAGLAAPQIGISLRVVVFAVEENPRYPNVEPVPRTVLINPVIMPLSEETEHGWEGCLSIPGMRGEVPRYKHLRYTGFDEHGNELDRTVSDFHARVVQHECDHLDGILYPQRIKDLSRFGFIDELEEAGLIPKVEE